MRRSSVRVLVLSAALGAMILQARVARADPTVTEACANAAEEAQPLRREGQLTRTRDKLLVCARPECPAFVRVDCARWLLEIEGQISSIAIRATDAHGRDMTNVRVTVDGKVVAETLDGRSIMIDPGEHTFTFESDGAVPVKQKVLAIEGEKNRIVAVSFKPIDKPVEAPPQEVPRPSSGPPTIAYVIGGAGVVALGVGVVLWLSGKSAHDKMESGCARTQSCSQSDVDSAKSRLLIGDVAAGIGVVAIGAAVVILVTRPRSATPRAAHLDVQSVSGGGLASFSTRF